MVLVIAPSAARREFDATSLGASRFAQCFPLFAELDNPEELLIGSSKSQTRVFVCACSNADAVFAVHSVAASTKSKTPSRFGATRRRKAWSKAGTFSSLAVFSLGN